MTLKTPYSRKGQIELMSRLILSLSDNLFILEDATCTIDSPVCMSIELMRQYTSLIIGAGKQLILNGRDAANVACRAEFCRLRACVIDQGLDSLRVLNVFYFCFCNLSILGEIKEYFAVKCGPASSSLKTFEDVIGDLHGLWNHWYKDTSEEVTIPRPEEVAVCSDENLDVLINELDQITDDDY